MFQITILQDYELIDSIETDCIIGTVHDSKNDELYQNLFYADCDELIVVRAIKALMKLLGDKMNDPDLAEEFLMDTSEADDGSGEVN